MKKYTRKFEEGDVYTKLRPLAKKYKVTTEGMYEALVNAFLDNREFYSKMYGDSEAVSEFIEEASLKDIVRAVREFKINFTDYLKGV